MLDKDSLIRVLLVDDHPMVREGLASMVDNRPDMTVVAQASNGQEACELFRQHRPDVTLMDLSMPEMSGMQALESIREEFPEARILILTVYDGDESIYQGFKAGARGYLLKDAPREEIVKAIRTVHAGQKCVPPEVAAQLSERLSKPELTRRELEVLKLMATGHSNLQIGNALFIAEGTVKAHVNTILQKLKVSDRTAAVTTAMKRGFVPLPSA